MIQKDFKFQRFIGISLSGAKNNKTALCALDYYPKQKKLFLSELICNIGPDSESSSDKNLLKHLKAQKKVKSIAFDVALQLPKCMRCREKCPGYEKCKLQEVAWMRDLYKQRLKDNKNAKWFSPFTDRCADYFLQNELESNFEIQHALSANVAPLTARAHFLLKHIKINCLEVNPKISLWRMGRSLNIQKSYLKYYKNAEDCEEGRLFTLDVFKKREILFIYNQDKQKLVSDDRAYDAMICALTAFLGNRKMLQPKPRAFPRTAIWPSIPKMDVFVDFESW